MHVQFFSLRLLSSSSLCSFFGLAIRIFLHYITCIEFVVNSQMELKINNWTSVCVCVRLVDWNRCVVLTKLSILLIRKMHGKYRIKYLDKVKIVIHLKTRKTRMPIAQMNHGERKFGLCACEYVAYKNVQTTNDDRKTISIVPLCSGMSIYR